MKVIVDRRELLAICKRASHIASSLSAVEELKGILLEADASEQTLTATATNFELSLRCSMKADVREHGAWVVNAKLLTGMLELLKGDRIAMHGRLDNTMLIAGDACRYLISVLPVRGYPKPEIPFPEDMVQVSGIPALAKRTVIAVSDNESDPVMRCVNLVFSQDGLRAVGSDGVRIISVKGDVKGSGAVNLLVPAKSIVTLANMVANDDELMVGATGQFIVFMRENFIFSARLMDGSYINADGLLQSVKGQFTVLTDGNTLWRTLDAVTAVADESAKVRLDFQGSQIDFCCTSFNSSAASSLAVIPLSGTPTGNYCYPAKKLTECLKVMKGTLQLQVAQNGLLLLETEYITCLQNTLRNSPVKKADKKKPQKAA